MLSEWSDEFARGGVKCRPQPSSCFSSMCSTWRPAPKANGLNSGRCCYTVYQTRNKTICNTVTVHTLAAAWLTRFTWQIHCAAAAAAACSHKGVSLHVHQHEGMPQLATCQPSFYAPDLQAPPSHPSFQIASRKVQSLYCNVPPAVPRPRSYLPPWSQRSHRATKGPYASIIATSAPT
jgi:hypothetical protein